ncbi:probable enoyl-CoA hydratase 2, mitochondrial isoform X2 [Phalaenopsis equestris]|uniref:probable enoyl-CoA hydratase 2, mitochondrial isoform X2 n=1 Tax=Phalaenopsis equestris TaxID=78828 RepID=UPI0009E46D9F|nr:probable enoyl-CoA hydratase 2, mitochondrial isoform X2 [Phalaenopsis equestris]
MLRLRSILSRCTVTNSCPVAYTVRYLHSSRHWRCPPHTSAPEAMAMPCHFRLFFCRTLIVQTAPSLVRIEKLSSSDSGIVDLKLERAEAKNAISKEMLKGLQNAIVEIDRDSSAKVVLVSSSIPRVFCAGADLKALSVPTIAVIEGAALGGGLEMALSCDLRICGEDAVFCMPETGLAIIPGAGGTQRLPRIVGRSLAKELIYTARRFGGREALTMGLANYCVQAGEAYSKALQIARDINEKGPLAIKMAKKAIDEGMLQGDLSSAMSVERECYEKLLYSQDRLEGLAAFAEKRKPIYAGK